MKRFMTTLLGAGLAILVAGAAHAEIFSVTRTAVPTFLTEGAAGNDLTITFTNPTTPSTGLNSADPGTFFGLLNYVVTANGTPGVQTFTNRTFSLDVLFTTGAGNHLETFNGTVNGTAEWDGASGKSNLIVALNPTTACFNIGGVQFDLDQMAVTPATAVNDPNAQGAITAHLNTPNAIPEPGSMALLAMGGLPFLGMIRRRRK